VTAREKPSFTFGIEEEYFLVDPRTRALASELPKSMLDECRAELAGHVSTEYQQSQIEVATRICMRASDAREHLGRLRNGVAAIASRHGMAPIAASTHPFTRWRTQRHTDKQRYKAIADDLKGVGRRMVIGGMHVHVGIDDADQRIAVMNEMRPYLPLLLGLSASSPFWQGENTGLKSYRTSINDATPRSGMPESFASWSDYQRTVETLVRSDVIEDATKIWWDLRPSARFPTLELRITDVCPLIEDALCIASLFRCLCRSLWRRNRKGRRSPSYPFLVLNENRWRAQRYGLGQGFIDLRGESITTSAALIDELLEIVGEDADDLRSTADIAHTRTILARGTSADRQLSVYQQKLDLGVTRPRALRMVVDQLIAETVNGI
jgi:glutamate---cysteine ligase / carboxylate-amine ligase